MSKAIWQEKQVIIDEIKAKLENAEAAVVIDYMGITVEEANSMRKQLREADVDYTVYKNTLVKRAIEGTKFEGLAEALAGPSALAISQTDATAPARVLNKVMKEFKKMEFKAGVIEGELLDAAGVQAVAVIPSRDELIAKFM
ncbi:MAG: 50S ribosomal protein L10, partial [Firmicutes bacterium]|nr:50S ribosomal protein L10 [Bacillota bacterium]